MKLRPLLTNPGRLVSEGRFALGTYKEPFREVNPLDAAIGAVFPVPRFLKNWRLKEWQHFALVNDDFYISLALFNAKTLALAQVCVYDRRNKNVHFYERKAAPWKVQIPTALWNAEAVYQTKGFTLRISNRLTDGMHRIEFEIEATKQLPALQGIFTCFEDLKHCEPLVVSLPFDDRRAMYSHKFICPIEGTLKLDGREICFQRENSYGLIDIHKGYYPYVMKWHWATGGGYDANQKLIGFNLTANQVKNPEQYNENCVWIDGKIHLLPAVCFTFDSGDLYQTWKIRDEYGMVDLSFRAQAIRTVDINALILVSRYRAPFGFFDGTIRTEAGQELIIKDYFGMCEDFYLRC